jgi:hypothetical protein
VKDWKSAWTAGAEARWTGTRSANPHEPGSARAQAWAAGWRWAERQPDRRRSTVLRFAHPRRRSTDRGLGLVRSAQAGAIGLSILAVIGWILRKRRS